ncbi:MAG: putative histidine kinase, hybrid [Panacagrimonas sp.]|nr:ATP-binding protein [Panacagrimonas sp.]MCC2657054.1 putative histidine kinase, hybrid [Panacagrimonas sp.]
MASSSPSTTATEFPIDAARAASREAFLAALDLQLRTLSVAHDVHRTAAQWLGARLQADRCTYAAVDDDGDTFEVIDHPLPQERSTPSRHRLSDYGPDVVATLQAGRSWTVDDIETDARIPDPIKAAYRAQRTAALMCVPLLREGRLVACMVLHAATARAWGVEEEGLLAAVASRCWESIGRVRAEDRARAREDRFRALVEDSDQILWTADAAGQIVEDSPSWRAFTGQSVERFLGSGWIEPIHPDDLPRIAGAVAEAMQQARGVDLEFRLRHADGSWRWVAEQIRPVLDADRRVREWVGLITDISARKEVEHSQRLLLQLDDAIRPRVDPDEIAAEAVRLLCVFLDAERSAYLEVAADQNTATALRSYAPDLPALTGSYSIDDYGRRFAGDIREGRPHVMTDVAQVSLTPAERRSFADLAIGSMINIPLLKAGRLVAIVGVYQRAPRAWSAAEQNLAVAVVSRCWESIERARITRELRDADRRKDQFLATLAHELRNPLAPLQNALLIARNPMSKIAPSRLFDMMDRQIQQLVRLVDDLLDISRITRGAIELNLETLALYQVLNVALETARPAMESAGHQVEVAPIDPGLCIRGDEVRLTQIFANLLSNAAKYTPPGGRIEVCVGSSSDAVSISVRDNGIGIPLDMQDRVFDMFTQVSQSRGQLQGGLGIGLALVKNLVHLHLGTIEVWSKGPMLGSEFIVTLPAVAPIQIRSPETWRPLNLSGSKIVVVDDNRDAADSVGDLFRGMGADVRVHYSGSEALRALGDFRPALAFLDIGMPEMDGYALAREIRRRHDEWGPIRLVALTGWGQDEDRRRSAEAGFDHHLTKPLNVDALTQVLA